MSARSFSGPWRGEPTEGGHFIVKDATGFSVCFVYTRREEALRSSYMTVRKPWPTPHIGIRFFRRDP